MKHTPGPWKVVEKDLTIRTDSYKLPQCGQGDYRGQIIASVDPEGWARGCREDVIPTMKANALHIVKCVNSHDELLESFKKITQIIGGENCSPSEFVRLADSLNVAEQAIAKAEGRAT